MTRAGPYLIAPAVLLAAPGAAALDDDGSPASPGEGRPPARWASGEPEGTDERTARGFYLRLGLGMGYERTIRETEARGSVASFLFLGDTSKITGLVASTELSVGGAVAPGLVLCGTWLGTAMPSAELEIVDGSEVELASSVAGFFLGPTVDVFPYDEGFHFGGGVGYAAYNAASTEPPGSIGGRGGGALLGVGYDIPWDDQWAVGLLLRGMVSRVLGTHESTGLTGQETTTRTFVGLAVNVRMY